MTQTNDNCPGLDPDERNATMPSPRRGECRWRRLTSEFPVRAGGAWLWAFHVCDHKANQAIVLLQIIYWCQAGRNGRPRSKFAASGGVAKSYAELATETGLTQKMVITAVRSLGSCGFVKRGTCIWRGRKTSLLMPQFEVIHSAIASLQSNVIESCRGTEF